MHFIRIEKQDCPLFKYLNGCNGFNSYNDRIIIYFQVIPKGHIS